MKPIQTDSLCQNEAQTLVSRLSLHAAHLRGLLATSEGETIAPPRFEANDLLGNIDLLSAHVTELEHRLGGNAPTFVTGLEEFGDTPRQSQSGSAAALSCSGAGETLTSKILRLRGVTSLEELHGQMGKRKFRPNIDD